MGAEEGAILLPQSPPEQLWGTGGGGGESGLWAMKAACHKAEKQGMQAAGEEGEAGPGSDCCPPSAHPCTLLGSKHAHLHEGWKQEVGWGSRVGCRLQQ